ncbi:MAG TPA: hypothetical protein VMQ17_16845 [Candidatus Sulfotelmatobacter sp.]|jgi:hypothetical protein|nr:hypothetical protein [Candidatus Sulfotelmatobacter sp.]
MANEVTGIFQKLAKVRESCVTANFSGLLRSVESLNSLTTMLDKIETDESFELACRRVDEAIGRFRLIAVESYDKNLLEDVTATPDIAKLQTALQTPEKETCLRKKGGLVAGTACRITVPQSSGQFKFMRRPGKWRSCASPQHFPAIRGATRFLWEPFWKNADTSR